MLRAVNFGLGERITACIVGASVRAVLARPLVGPMVVRGCMLRGIPLESEELSSTNRNEIQILCRH
jgi:hypothetical protein